jgi:hypothetical protein
MSLANPHDTPIWVLLLDSNAGPVPETNVFDSGGHLNDFGRSVYFGTEGAVVELVSYSRPMFRAFRLPSQGEVVFEHYTIEAPTKDLKVIDVWEVSELRVNGTTPLDQWLPYKTLSDKRVLLNAKAVSEWLDNPKLATVKRGEYPKEKVERVTANVLHRWKIPVRRLPHEQP